MDKIKNIRQMFPWSPRVGLDKIGNNSCMNAIIQCFCQIEEFASYFKYDDYINKIIDKYNHQNKKCLTSSFKILIDKIWPDEGMKIESKNRHFSPEEFRKKISDMNPLLVKNNNINNIKDLLLFIILTLHEELNDNLDYNNINQIKKNDLNDRNKEQMFNVFYDEYLKQFRSKISELFCAIQKNAKRCLYCDATSYDFQEYFFLVFPLYEVKKYSIKKL